MSRNRKNAQFVKTPHGVKIIIPSASVTIDTLDIVRLNAFMASGDLASTPQLVKAMQHNGTLAAIPTDELEAELAHRARMDNLA